MGKSCVAANCTNRSDNTENVSFHTFPRKETNEERYNTWVTQVQRTRLNWNGPTSRHTYVCRDHFTPESFEETIELKHKLGMGTTSVKRLKADAVPSIFNQPTYDPTKAKRRRSALEKIKRKRILDKTLNSSMFYSVDNYIEDTASNMGTVDPEWLKMEIRSAVLDVCKENRCFPGDIEVDGLICISPHDESDNQLVVKIHTLIIDPKNNVSSSHGSKTADQDSEIQASSSPSIVNLENDVDTHSEAGNTSSKESKCWTIGDNLCLVEDGEESDDVESLSKRRRTSSNGEDLPMQQENEIGATQNFETGDGKNTLITKMEPLQVYTSYEYKPLNEPTKSTKGTIDIKEGSSGLTTNECKVKEDETFTCTQCDTVFCSLGSMQYHVEHDHVDYENVNMLICRFCGKTYSRKDVLQHHVANHFVHNPYKCGVCKKNFCDKGTVYKHVKTQHKVLKVCFCNVCLTGFIDDQALHEHKQNDCVQGSTEVCCPWCDHTAVNAVLVASHVISSHWQQINSPLKSELSY